VGVRRGVEERVGSILGIVSSITINLYLEGFRLGGKYFYSHGWLFKVLFIFTASFGDNWNCC
jgi:hypothetical protein